MGRMPRWNYRALRRWTWLQMQRKPYVTAVQLRELLANEMPFVPSRIYMQRVLRDIRRGEGLTLAGPEELYEKQETKNICAESKSHNATATV